MNGRLSILQVAALLLSASYGVGFLFGSGELALKWGMAGSIYAVATAFGMLLLALFAGRLWRARAPIWDVFGRYYGAQVKTMVAGLSVLWMGGVLAAQIHGGIAVARLMGLPEPLDYALVLMLILLVSRMELGVAAKALSVGLLASTGILVYALFAVQGGDIYAQALPRFAHDLSQLPSGHWVVIVLAVTALVVTGADYQQFVIAARGPRSAAAGCLLAGVLLLACGFLPASVVIAYSAQGATSGLELGTQVMPFIMSRVAAGLGGGAEWLLLAGLLAAALGSGAAIVRSMSSAIESALPVRAPCSRDAITLAVLLLGAIVAARGQAIVETMVSLNVVYIASIGLVFVGLYAGVRLAPAAAQRIMGAGFVVSFVVYLGAWCGWWDGRGDALSLLAGVGASGITALALRLHPVADGALRLDAGFASPQGQAGSALAR